MKKGIKILLIILGVIIILGLTFFTVDYNRVQKQEKPIFCVKDAIANDGGTEEYLGLGYKVIDFNRYNGYDEMKIGSWFMKYEDFEDEYKEYGSAVEEIDPEVVINGYNNMPDITITGEDTTKIKQILDGFSYDGELCDGIYSYEIIINDEEHYMVKQDCKAIEKGDKQADITEEELKSIEDIIEKNINEHELIENVPVEYPIDQAIKDGCVVISNNAVFNKGRLDDFIINTSADNENRQSDFIRIVKYTIEGDPIITDLEYKKGAGYILTYDNTRDAFGADTKITTYEDMPEEIYNVALTEDDNCIYVTLALQGVIDYDSESEREYEPMTVVNYSKELTTYEISPSFIGEVTDVNEKVLTVKSEDKNIGDAVFVSVEDTSDYTIGDKIEVFYTGEVLETYPCQIYEIDVRKIDE